METALGQTLSLSVSASRLSRKNLVSQTSYSVNADCTGSLTVLGGPTFSLFIAPDGGSIASLATNPGSSVASIDSAGVTPVETGEPGQAG